MHQHRAPPPGFLPQSQYSRAKAQLRRQLPAYQTAITMAVQWDRIVLWLLTLAAYFASFGVRFVYLVTGRIYTRQDVSVAYSWVILAAEIITGTIAMHDTHLFWKQTVTFTRVDRNSEEHRDKVRPLHALPQLGPALIVAQTAWGAQPRRACEQQWHARPRRTHASNSRGSVAIAAPQASGCGISTTRNCTA